MSGRERKEIAASCITFGKLEPSTYYLSIKPPQIDHLGCVRQR